ncbi:hypothetical protein A1O3_05804 [Capronia epimyces CBS 606.96]|uniref:SprT-like domain-containing protein n=1 Tax=Capronia epimyces CBS 606.96 TaxID=1182542 RepID=W9YS65_9EURO|nr:uncharacterized protein A1O3_05804 [Capronia epimyces CBS 606.96]EXJ85129.1 hypothetical protein A1O3_05804 [Capronia epimyces CBS 606.96]
MSPYSSEDDLPDLAAILAPKPLMATGTNTSLRRSPRKQAALGADVSRSPEKRDRGIPSPRKQVLPSSRPIAREHLSPEKLAVAKKPQSSVGLNVPLLPRNSTTTEATLRLSSNNLRSPANGRRPLKVSHVDSLLLPLKAMALEESDTQTGHAGPVAEAGMRFVNKRGKAMMSDWEKATRSSKAESVACKDQPRRGYASRFVLTEAWCNDDGLDSMDEEDEDEDTDLSGFIVDDDAELSYHDSPSSESDDDKEMSRRSPTRPVPRRRLQRGSPARRRLSFSRHESSSQSDKENEPADKLSHALQDMCLDHDKQHKRDEREVEVIDLTSSPVQKPEFGMNTRSELDSREFAKASPPNPLPVKSIPLDDLDAILKLEAPLPRPALLLPPKNMPTQRVLATDGEDGKGRSDDRAEDESGTLPATPPRSPTKLKSPSKLLSPSKRQTIPQSPHRQSMDSFWDHNVINEWNDAYSPRKVPATSPRKRLFAPFTIFSDSDSDSASEKEHKFNESSDSLPSPCSSPRKSKSRPQSPTKSPEKVEKKRLLEEKRAAAIRKKEFDARKEKMAIDLLRELDINVADSRLGSLSHSTGGVQIKWSKTLRSTAGRANWKRTVTRLSGSPVKGGENEGPGVNVRHYASVELAEKIIDCEDRLVNTLAHEFCHLANFMISNVRDQPHGASFKRWAAKVTSHLRQSHVDVWRQVQVTTKHSYVINHKYLWACVGRDRTPAMDFLNLDQDGGCGAEYGRHSKSIDTEKHRCGRCKGRLVQVRPKPRASPQKKSKTGSSREGSVESSGSGSGSRSSSDGRTGSVLGSMIEEVELSD